MKKKPRKQKYTPLQPECDDNYNSVIEALTTLIARVNHLAEQVATFPSNSAIQMIMKDGVAQALREAGHSPVPTVLMIGDRRYTLEEE